MKIYDPSTRDLAEMERRFLPGGQIGAECCRLATVLLQLCPPGRELSLALTQLEQAMLWALTSQQRGG
jgi:hypothetical protein